MRANKFPLIKRMLILSLAMLSILFAVGCAAENGGSTEDIAFDDQPTTVQWGQGITESIPEFSGEAEAVVAGKNGNYATAYYVNVSGAQIDEYISVLESRLNIKFDGEKYPKIANLGEKTIILHYNVTEMEFSVTIAKP